MQMPCTHRSARIQHCQSCTFGLVGQTIVAPGFPQTEIRRDWRDRRFENPGVLAVGALKMPELSIGGLVPTRKAEHPPSERFFFEQRERLVEKDVRVGDYNCGPLEMQVRICKQL